MNGQYTQQQFVAEIARQYEERPDAPTAADMQAARENVHATLQRMQELETAIRTPATHLPAKARHDYYAGLRHDLAEAQQAHAQAVIVHDDVARRGGRTAEAKEHAQAQRAMNEQTRARHQYEHARAQEEVAKAEARAAYLAAGGTPEDFRSAWRTMWPEELARRTMEGQQHMRTQFTRSGKYSL